MFTVDIVAVQYLSDTEQRNAEQQEKWQEDIKELEARA